jgi:hypothetical protein
MRIGVFIEESRRYASVLALGLCLDGCSGLPNWTDGADSGATVAVQESSAFPDLSQLPAPPGPPPSAAARGAIVQTLEAARLQNQQAGENLAGQIESEFEFPASSSN